MPEQQSPQALRPDRAPSVPLQALLDLTGATLLGSPNVNVTGIEQRSSAVRQGDLFAALPGANAHGARFTADAIARGAVAVYTDAAGADQIGDVDVPVLIVDAARAQLGELSAEIYGHPSDKLTIIGITGTSGKTTTSYLVEAGLQAAGLSTGLIGTIETRIGGRRVPSALTTPEAPQLHAMFAAMVEQGVDAVVMEVSSHALALGRVDGVRFAVGAFTNLSQDHLDFHADFEDYFAAKRLLFDANSPVAARTSVICVDDAWGKRLASDLAAQAQATTTAAELAAQAAAADLGSEPHTQATDADNQRTDRSAPITVSTTGDAASWHLIGDIKTAGGEQEFTARTPHDTELPVRLRLPGRYNVANALLAVATCAAAGVDPATAAPALATVDVPGRMQRVERGQDFLAVVDYAHKPAAVESVVATLRGHLTEAGSGRLAVIVGAGGDRDAAKRPLMGAAAAREADLVIVTDDNPRSEDPAAIRAAVAAGALALPTDHRAEIREIGDRADAIAAALAWARTGDVVLVAGKGHESGQEVNGVKQPFDDREVLARHLDSLLAQQSPATDSEDLTVS
ncbi:Mur ligase family protein [Nocardia camponoti]|uniref:UDP-N-acetylmuramoyl-L-alanyl-D-glutamate--2,6-diaminopimelate ligase n=1 Tax=Nocardia camponoti TaxID=1616106 RepID=A0A917VDT2_9NOCA|nr:UDP-N-acetylmuramoyl-L-alanyl-D-glutamate--2,6-diaminopimelate ligase [Nocardia camponoti]GGK66076.1 UDP-N-acetylmuramoyl-L-alanyl-D-glutamate--2,6-diaminopimelate ligase [Nocardia camponoti]